MQYEWTEVSITQFDYGGNFYKFAKIEVYEHMRFLKKMDVWQYGVLQKVGFKQKSEQQSGVLGTIFGERNPHLFRVNYFQSIK